jgi:hypothetical protein
MATPDSAAAPDLLEDIITIKRLNILMDMIITRRILFMDHK